MNALPRPPRSTDEEQAALWAARLDGSVLSAADRVAFETWLAEDPARRALLSEYCQLSADLEQRLPLLAGIKERSAEIPPAPIVVPRPWSRRPLWAGAMLTAAAAVALAFFLAGRPATQSASFATSVGERQALTLADGTRVELNTQTALVVDLGRSERRVRLANGEAFFAVSKEAARPFIVETPAGLVRVTGTQFDVRAESGPVLEVIVTEGHVQAAAGTGAPVGLGVGDRLWAGPQGMTVTAMSAAELDRALAWREGQIVFAGTPLAEALTRFSRYHGRVITVSPGAAGLRIGGRHSLDDLSGFLAGLERSFPVNVVTGPDGAVRVDPRPEP
jgi:transmembrane sensor